MTRIITGGIGVASGLFIGSRLESDIAMQLGMVLVGLCVVAAVLQCYFSAPMRQARKQKNESIY